MAKLVIYRVGDRVPDEIAGPLCNQSGADGIISTQHLFDTPSAGQRAGIREYQTNGSGELTHSRPGPWFLETVEVYPSSEGAAFSEIVLCTCAYAPIPEKENPWVPVKRLEVREAAIAA